MLLDVARAPSVRWCLSLLMTTAVLAGCSSDEPPDVGTVVEARDPQSVEGPGGWVMVPSGRLDLRVGPAGNSVNAGAVATAEGFDAPDDASVVGVAWTFDDGASVPHWQRPLVAGDVLPEVTLVADGERYRVGEVEVGMALGEAFFVVVAGTPDALSFEVAYDGVVQTLEAGTGERDPGAASALYDDPGARPQEASCALDEWAAGITADMVCGASVTRLPYVAGAGWAADGELWAAVRLESRVLGVRIEERGRAASYAVTRTEDASTLDGEEPTSSSGLTPTDPGDRNDVLVFASTPGEPLRLDVRRTYTIERESGSLALPASRTVPTSVIVDLPAPA